MPRRDKSGGSVGGSAPAAADDGVTKHTIKVLEFSQAVEALRTRADGDDDDISIESETVSLTDCM